MGPESVERFFFGDCLTPPILAYRHLYSRRSLGAALSSAFEHQWVQGAPTDDSIPGFPLSIVRLFLEKTSSKADAPLLSKQGTSTVAYMWRPSLGRVDSHRCQSFEPVMHDVAVVDVGDYHSDYCYSN
eukprot:COSAG02_NODE_676_length_18610_cov_44.695532_3_plen_128_part_00